MRLTSRVIEPLSWIRNDGYHRYYKLSKKHYLFLWSKMKTAYRSKISKERYSYSIYKKHTHYQTS